MKFGPNCAYPCNRFSFTDFELARPLQCFIDAGQDARERSLGRNRNQLECPVDCTPDQSDQIVFTQEFLEGLRVRVVCPGHDTRPVRWPINGTYGVNGGLHVGRRR